jgi:hypothetical protein
MRRVVRAIFGGSGSPPAATYDTDTDGSSYSFDVVGPAPSPPGPPAEGLEETSDLATAPAAAPDGMEDTAAATPAGATEEPTADEPAAEAPATPGQLKYNAVKLPVRTASQTPSRYSLRPRNVAGCSDRNITGGPGAVGKAPVDAMRRALLLQQVVDPRVKEVEEASVKSLRAICGQLGLKKDGPKAVLRERALEAFDAQAMQYPHSKYVVESMRNTSVAWTGAGAAERGPVGDLASVADTNSEVNSNNSRRRRGTVSRGVESMPTDSTPYFNRAKHRAAKSKAAGDAVGSRTNSRRDHACSPSTSTRRRVATTASRVAEADSASDAAADATSAPAEFPDVAQHKMDEPNSSAFLEHRGITHESTPRISGPAHAAEASPTCPEDVDDVKAATNEGICLTPPPAGPRCTSPNSTPAALAVPAKVRCSGVGIGSIANVAGGKLSNGPGPSRRPLQAIGGPTESVDAQFSNPSYRNDRCVAQDNTSSAINTAAQVTSNTNFASTGKPSGNAGASSIINTNRNVSVDALLSPSIIAAPPAIPRIAMGALVMGAPGTGASAAMLSPLLDCARGAPAPLRADAVALPTGVSGNILDVPPRASPTVGVAVTVITANGVPEPGPVKQTATDILPASRIATANAVTSTPNGSPASAPFIARGTVDADAYILKAHGPPPPTPSDPNVAEIMNEYAAGRRFQTDVVAGLNSIHVAESGGRKRSFKEMFQSMPGMEQQNQERHRQLPPGAFRMGMATPPGTSLRATPDHDAASERKKSPSSPQILPPPGKKFRRIAQAGPVVSEGVAALAAGPGRPANLGPFSGVLAGAVGGPWTPLSAAAGVTAGSLAPAGLVQSSRRATGSLQSPVGRHAALPPPVPISFGTAANVIPVQSAAKPPVPKPPVSKPMATSRAASVEHADPAFVTPEKIARPQARRPSGLVTPQDIIRTLQNKTPGKPFCAGIGLNASKSPPSGSLDLTYAELQRSTGHSFRALPSKHVGEFSFSGSKMADRRESVTSRRSLTTTMPRPTLAGRTGVGLGSASNAFGTFKQRHGSSASGGLVTDLRPAFPPTYSGARGFSAAGAGGNSVAALQSPSLHVRNGLAFAGGASDGILESRERDRVVAVSSSAKKILASLDKVSAENRTAVSKRTRSPLGLPPSKKRQRRPDHGAGENSGGNVIGGAEWFMTTIQAHAAAAAAAAVPGPNQNTSAGAPGASRKRLVVGAKHGENFPTASSRPPAYGVSLVPASTDTLPPNLSAHQPERSAFKPYGVIGKSEGAIGKRKRRTAGSSNVAGGIKTGHIAAAMAADFKNFGAEAGITQNKPRREPFSVSTAPLPRANCGSASNDNATEDTGEETASASQPQRAFSCAPSTKYPSPSPPASVIDGPAPVRTHDPEMLQSQVDTPKLSKTAPSMDNTASVVYASKSEKNIAISNSSLAASGSSPLAFGTSEAEVKDDAVSPVKDVAALASAHLVFGAGSSPRVDAGKETAVPVVSTCNVSAASTFPQLPGGSVFGAVPEKRSDVGYKDDEKTEDGKDDENGETRGKARLRSFEIVQPARETLPPVAPSGPSFFNFNIPTSGAAVAATCSAYGSIPAGTLSTKQSVAFGETELRKPDVGSANDAESPSNTEAAPSPFSSVAPLKPKTPLSTARFSFSTPIPGDLFASSQTPAEIKDKDGDSKPITFVSTGAHPLSSGSGLTPYESTAAIAATKSASVPSCGVISGAAMSTAEASPVVKPVFSLSSPVPEPSAAQVAPEQNVKVASFSAAPFSSGVSTAALAPSSGGELTHVTEITQPSPSYGNIAPALFGSMPFATAPTPGFSSPALAFGQTNQTPALSLFGFPATAPASAPSIASGPIFGSLGATASVAGNPFSSAGTPFPTSSPPPSKVGASPSSGVFTFGQIAPPTAALSASGAVLASTGPNISFGPIQAATAPNSNFSVAFGGGASDPFGVPLASAAAGPLIPAFSANASPFGAPTLASPAFGAPTLASPAFGAPALASPAFGAPTLASPAFGAPTLASPAFGAPTQASPAFGAPTQASPAFGAPTQAAPAFGAPSQAAPAFGGPALVAPACGAPTSAAAFSFATTASMALSFGTPAGVTPSFGAPSPPPSQNSFGAAQPAYGMPQATAPAFGIAPQAFGQAPAGPLGGGGFNIGASNSNPPPGPPGRRRLRGRRTGQK